MATFQDPRLKLPAHSQAVLAEFESILASNLSWLTDHLDQVQHEWNRGGSDRVSLAQLIKTPKRQRHPQTEVSPLTRNPFLLPTSTLNKPINALQQVTTSNPFASSQKPRKNNKPRSPSPSLERQRTSTTSSLEDEAAIEASLLAPARPVTPVSPPKKQLPRPKTPVLSPKASHKSLKATSIPSRPNSPAFKRANSPAPPRAHSPLPKHIVKSLPPRPQSPSHLPRPMSPMASFTAPAAFVAPSSPEVAMDVDLPVSEQEPPQHMVAEQSTNESEQPVEELNPVQEAAELVQPETHEEPELQQSDAAVGEQEKAAPRASALPPSPISAFLSSHASRPSALSFRGLPGREKSLGLVKSIQFNSRLTLNQADTTSEAEPASLKRKSDMVDMETSDRYNKLFKTDSASKPVPPQNRIEALMNKVQSMSKGIAINRLSTDPAALNFSQPSQPSQSQSKHHRSPVAHTFGSVSTPRQRSPPKALPVASPAVKNAFKMFSQGTAAFEESKKSPPKQGSSPAKPVGLVRQSSVTDLVRAFESRNAALPEPQQSPRKMLRNPHVEAIAESTTPPSTPPVLMHHQVESVPEEIEEEMEVPTSQAQPEPIQKDAHESRESPEDYMDALSLPESVPMPMDFTQHVEVVEQEVREVLVVQQEEDVVMHEPLPAEEESQPVEAPSAQPSDMVEEPAETQEDYTMAASETSTSGLAAGFLSQAANLLSKSLGNNAKKVAAPGIKSLQLATAAKEKEQLLKDKKAALKEEREQQRRLLTIAKEQDDQRQHHSEAPIKKASEIKRPDSALSTHKNPTLVLKPKGSTASTISQNAKAKPSRVQSTSKTQIEDLEKKASIHKPVAGPSRAPSVAAEKQVKPREPSRSAQPLANKSAANGKATLKLNTKTTTTVQIAKDKETLTVNTSQKIIKPTLAQLESEPYVELPDIASEYSDSDDDTRAEKASKLPDWAQSPELRAALMAQSNIDPDDIFGAIQPLHMEELFKGKTNRFRARSSSAYWSGADALTQAEELAYAKRMNYQSSSSKLRE